jgi:EAL domain-containing protein (putative c-di-GMP-specific phosphodiesterase class I)
MPAIPSIAVNLSGRSLSEPSLPQYISDELRQAGVDPRRLIVEITETAAVSDLHDAQRMIEALHQLGCGVYLDDFGVGFSSFAYLKHLRVDTIKIDGMFIRDLSNDPDNQVFVQAMVSVALGLGKSVVAEYVEDGSTLDAAAPVRGRPGAGLPPRPADRRASGTAGQGQPAGHKLQGSRRQAEAAHD